jgi:hypothetical protein
MARRAATIAQPNAERFSTLGAWGDVVSEATAAGAPPSVRRAREANCL